MLLDLANYNIKSHPSFFFFVFFFFFLYIFQIMSISPQEVAKHNTKSKQIIDKTVK